MSSRSLPTERADWGRANGRCTSEHVLRYVLLNTSLPGDKRARTKLVVASAFLLLVVPQRAETPSADAGCMVSSVLGPSTRYLPSRLARSPGFPILYNH